MEIDLLSNPIALIGGGAVLLLVLYFWNQSNASRSRNRRQRNFRKNYYERKKDVEKKNE